MSVLRACVKFFNLSSSRVFCTFVIFANTLYTLLVTKLKQLLIHECFHLKTALRTLINVELSAPHTICLLHYWKMMIWYQLPMLTTKKTRLSEAVVWAFPFIIHAIQWCRIHLVFSLLPNLMCVALAHLLGYQGRIDLLPFSSLQQQASPNCWNFGPGLIGDKRCKECLKANTF